MWRGTFDLTTPLSAQNNEGLCTQDPFCVPWADEINSSFGATRYGPNNSRIKVLFESRYGVSKLNIGFHPSATNFMFVQAYLSLVNCLAPEKYQSVALSLKKTYSERPDVQVAIDGILEGKLPLQQNFPEKTREASAIFTKGTTEGHLGESHMLPLPSQDTARHA